MSKHDGSNRYPCTMCGQKRGAWTSDYCTGTAPVLVQRATDRQVDYLRRLIVGDYALAATYGLQATDPATLSKDAASRAISMMTND